MAWQKLKGWKGRVYIPQPCPADRKHPCKECFACQRCSDERCAVCRSQEAGNGRDRPKTEDPAGSS